MLERGALGVLTSLLRIYTQGSNPVGTVTQCKTTTVPLFLSELPTWAGRIPLPFVDFFTPLYCVSFLSLHPSCLIGKMASIWSKFGKVLPQPSGTYEKIYSDDEENSGKPISVAQPDSAASTSINGRESEQLSFHPGRRRSKSCLNSITPIILFLCFSILAGSAFWVLSKLFGGLRTKAGDIPVSELEQNSNQTGHSPASSFRKAVVIASYKAQNVGWLADLPPEYVSP